ncbi:MAG: hypothetical protein KGS48_07680 [Bacteroidetes bacterium]|nr:hypothetical protein [Bacteroidota bacterium]
MTEQQSLLFSIGASNPNKINDYNATQDLFEFIKLLSEDECATINLSLLNLNKNLTNSEPRWGITTILKNQSNGFKVTYSRTFSTLNPDSKQFENTNVEITHKDIFLK